MTSRLAESLDSLLFNTTNQLTNKSAHPGDLIDRWRLTSDLFGRVFCDDVGIEPCSVVRQLAGFQLKEARFRREMERLRNMATREITIDQVERTRANLLVSTFKALNNMYAVQCSRRVSTMSGAATYPPPLCLSRVKVTFKDEQGEGSGVARSFFTAFAEAVLADEPFPTAVNFLAEPSGLGGGGGGGGGSAALAGGSTCSPPPQYIPFSMHRYRNSYRSSGLSNERRLNSTIIIRSSLRARDPPLPPSSLLANTSPSTNLSQSKIYTNILKHK